MSTTNFRTLMVMTLLAILVTVTPATATTYFSENFDGLPEGSLGNGTATSTGNGVWGGGGSWGTSGASQVVNHHSNSAPHSFQSNNGEQNSGQFTETASGIARAEVSMHMDSTSGKVGFYLQNPTADSYLRVVWGKDGDAQGVPGGSAVHAVNMIGVGGDFGAGGGVNPLGFSQTSIESGWVDFVLDLDLVAGSGSLSWTQGVFGDSLNITYPTGGSLGYFITLGDAAQQNFHDDILITDVVPEPVAWILMTLGGLGLFSWRRRRV